MKKMTKKEHEIFETLRSGDVISRPVLLSLVWGYPTDMAEKVAKTTRTVDMTVSRLKRKLPKGMTIETYHGRGYRLIGEK